MSSPGGNLDLNVDVDIDHEEVDTSSIPMASPLTVTVPDMNFEENDNAQDAEEHSPTYAYSAMYTDSVDNLQASRVSDSGNRNTLSASRVSEGGRGTISANANEVFSRNTLFSRSIAARAPPIDSKPERTKDYKGRKRVWPGVLLVLLLVGAAGTLITYFGMQTRDSKISRAAVYEAYRANASAITGGKGAVAKDDIISDDGAIGNPKKYPASGCELPNYKSKNGQIVAVSSNGTEVSLRIKGINWFGMETGQHVPFGMWDNEDNGTTAYQVATFLRNNKFNAVRLPVMISAILENNVPNTALVNKQENRAIDLKNYMTLLQSIVKVLQYRNIGVLISLHTLTFSDNGKLWYNGDISEDKFLEAVDKLTGALCSKEYWNVMGLDLKNEPYKGTWGDGGPTDFRAGAARIANRMLKGCPSWMGFVEGINAEHVVNIDGKAYPYYDWYGGGLHGAKTKGVEFNIPDKVVYAPHYYTPAVFPQMYLYGGGTPGGGNTISNYIELDDDTLRHRIKVTMDDMFGFLADKGPALLLGEFGGLYAEDAHPKKTTQRCTDFSIEIIKHWAGGFVWSLNPESAYQYNPADKAGNFVEGVLQKDWLKANTKFLEGMAAMDDMENLKPWPCFATKAT